MKFQRAILIAFAAAMGWVSGSGPISEVQAAVTVHIDRNAEDAGFHFSAVGLPAKNDAAAGARFAVVAGERDPNGAELEVLSDGLVPTDEDQPGACFFFRAGTKGGRIRVDLGSVIRVGEVATYSWHSGSRGPQVYTLYGADGTDARFQSDPGDGVDPLGCGWVRLTQVDTRPRGDEVGGQFGVAVREDSGALGRFRYLLFVVSATREGDPFSNTFFGEIDVLDADAPAPERMEREERRKLVLRFEAGTGRYAMSIDSTVAPDLADWAERELKPVVQEWYPKLVAMFPSDGFQALTNVVLRFRTDMGGTPASAGRGRVNLNAGWFRRELEREARGAVVHELVHVVQDYGRARRGNGGSTRTPGWLVEGIADYVRWFLYEPETRGAEITARNLERARYDASYRITANFLNWVVVNFDADLVAALNAAAREGRYEASIWEQRTGKSLEALGEAWRQAQVERVERSRATTR